MYDTLDTVRRWSSDAVWRWSSAARGYLRCSPTFELRRKRTLPHGNNFKPEVWHKNNKALIKAENLKGLFGYPTCKLFGFTFAILKIEDEKIC